MTSTTISIIEEWLKCHNGESNHIGFEPGDSVESLKKVTLDGSFDLFDLVDRVHTAGFEDGVRAEQEYHQES